MTVRCSSSVRPGKIGSESVSAAARSVTGSSACRPRSWMYAWRWTGSG
jgi:hypothetical protein